MLVSRTLSSCYEVRGELRPDYSNPVSGELPDDRPLWSSPVRWSTLRRGSSKLPGGSSPSKEKKVAAAKRAPVGQEDPAESLLDGVADAYTSKIDRSAMRTTSRKHSVASFLYIQLSQRCWRKGPGQSRMTAWSHLPWHRRRGPRSGRLVSRAA